MHIHPKIAAKIKTNKNLTNLKYLFFKLPFQFLNPESYQDRNQEFIVSHYFGFPFYYRRLRIGSYLAIFCYALGMNN